MVIVPKCQKRNILKENLKTSQFKITHDIDFPKIPNIFSKYFNSCHFVYEQENKLNEYECEESWTPD